MPGVHQLQARGANVVLLVGKRITLIDTGVRGSTSTILRYLRRLGRSPQDMSHIIITHFHVDHVGSLAALKRATGAKVAVHPGDAPIVDGTQHQPVPLNHPLLQLASFPFRPLFHTRPAPVDVLLEDGMEIESWPGLRAVHVPGHTPGSVCLYDKERGLLIAGDALREKGRDLYLPPRIFCTNPEQAAASLRKIAALEFDTLCLGHGRPFTPAADRQVRHLLAACAPGALARAG